MKDSLIAIGVIILIVLLLALIFHAQAANIFKHIQSSTVGLDREITLYNNTGGVIRQWRTKAKVEDKGGTCYFICDGKAFTISGTFIIEETNVREEEEK